MVKTFLVNENFYNLAGMKAFLLLGMAMISLISMGQTTPLNSPIIIQISGKAVDEVSLQEIPYVTVWNKTINKGVLSDEFGFFTLVAYPGDSLIFHAFGYVKSTYVVPDTLTDNRYSMVHLLQVDAVTKREIVIYPWSSKKEFEQYFLNMRPYEDAIRRAQRELSGESLAFAAARLGNDPSLAYGNLENQRFTKLYTNGQLPVNNLLNPLAWSSLIRELKAGKLSRQ